MAHKLLSTSMTMWNLSAIKSSANLAQTTSRCMSSSSSANIGFIGLGNMGKRMAVNLMKKVCLNVNKKKKKISNHIFLLLSYHILRYVF